MSRVASRIYALLSVIRQQMSPFYPFRGGVCPKGTMSPFFTVFFCLRASLRVKTKRPDDYFAKMAKSDQHMDKIRAKLLSKGAGEDREDQKASGAEKIRKEGAGGSSAEEAEGEEGNAGRDEEDEEGAGGQQGQYLGQEGQ